MGHSDETSRAREEAQPVRSVRRRDFVMGGVAAAIGGASAVASAATPSEAKTLTPWELPVRHLNALWNDLYPRLAARIWRGDTNDPNDWFNGPGTDNEWLAGMADDFANNILGTSGFTARMHALRDYLLAPRAVPILYHDDVEGWDFVLSEDGLDLFRPDDPDPNPAAAKADLLAYYSYRSTGRAAVAVPELGLPSGASSSDLDEIGPGVRVASPQGPSQVDLCGGTGLVGWAGKDRREERRGSIRDFVCQQARWWQITGAVYRGIMVEYPRAVAHIWLGNNFGGYQTKFAQPDADGLRHIFRQRLETHLPDYATPVSGTVGTGMLFQVDTPRPDTITWESDRVNITHQGFFFPELSDPGDFPNMLTAIIEGRAGNPVFTDSSMSA